MANEITVAASLNLTRTTQLANWDTGALSFNQIGSRKADNIQNVTTTGGAVNLGAVGTLGYMLIKSLDTTTNNIIYLMRTSGDTTGSAFAQLGPGEIILLKAGPGLTAPYATAGSTASQIQCLVLEL